MEKLNTSPGSMSASEIEMLADRMAAASAAREAYYRHLYKLDPEGAKKRAFPSPEKAQHIMTKPASEITWDDLDVVHRCGPEGAYVQLWNRIKEDMHVALTGGAFISAAVAENSPSMRALCLAAREQFSEQWQVRGSIEQTLIDMLAQTSVKWQMWLSMEVKWGNLKDQYEWSDRPEPQPEPHRGPRLNFAEAAQYAAQMADRSHRQFMRTLRAMRDLRRFAVNITIHNEGQVNIGQNQVNQTG